MVISEGNRLLLEIGLSPTRYCPAKINRSLAVVAVYLSVVRPLRLLAFARQYMDCAVLLSPVLSSLGKGVDF